MRDYNIHLVHQAVKVVLVGNRVMEAAVTVVTVVVESRAVVGRVCHHAAHAIGTRRSWLY